MNCRVCNMPMENTFVCPHCGTTDKVLKKIIYSSNWHYNRGLQRARVKDLSGAIVSLTRALKYNKRNTDARNLLGLIYYQMGEIVPALGEWVISVHFQEKGNLAAEYIERIQNNPAKLDAANRVIQRYNQALKYIAQKNDEMAVIELKKVVNMSPTYVKAYQVLGLLYMRRKQYRNARKALMSAVKVDRNNMDTLRYMRELNQVYKRSDQDRRSGFTQISDPNPIVIEENTSPDIREYNTGFLSFVNVLIGIVIGAAVIWLLIVPSITKRNAADYNQQVIEYSAQIAERNKEIDGLQNQISDLQTDLSRYQSEVGDAVNDAGASQQLLWQAMAAFLHDDTYEAGNAVAGIDPSALTDAQMKQVYEQLRERTGDAVTDALYSQALASYESGDFLASIEGFTKVLRMDDEYNSAIFYMGRAYHQLGDLVNAATYYKRLVQSAPDTQMGEEAQNYLDQIQAAAGTDVGEAAQKANDEADAAKQAEEAAAGEDEAADQDGEAEGQDDEDFDEGEAADDGEGE